MAGGMRLDNDDIRALPLHMQEQLGTALVVQMAQVNDDLRKHLGVVSPAQALQAFQVAGREETPHRQKTHVRRLRFRNIHAARRFLTLREEERNGEISDLVLHMNENYAIDRFTYSITEEY